MRLKLRHDLLIKQTLKSEVNKTSWAKKGAKIMLQHILKMSIKCHLQNNGNLSKTPCRGIFMAFHLMSP